MNTCPTFPAACVRAAAVLTAWLVVASTVERTLAQQAPGGVLPPERRQYGPLDASADAFRAEDGRRMAEIDSQLGLNNRMRYQSWYGSLYRGVFEPWPMVPGDIWGYPMLSPVRQSIGQRSYQAGPNRWISEPVYAEDVAPVQGAAGPVIARPLRSAPPLVGVPVAPRANPRRPVELPGPRPEPSDVPVPTGPREF